MMYQAKILGAALMIFGLFGCGKQPADKLAIIKGQAYLIPWQDKPVVDLGADSEDIYVRVKKKLSGEQYFILLFDPRGYSVKSVANIPSLFGLNGDSEADLLERLIEVPTADFSIFCDRREDNKPLPAPRSCGFRVQDGDVSWSVDFSSIHIDDAPMMKTEAAKILKSYREAANAK